AVLIDMHCNASGGGMGTSGLVGVFGVIEATPNIYSTVFGIIFCLFVLPAILSFVISEFMRKKEWIKFGDMKLPE
ncbi:MAG: PTS sugar transporter subunit IIC, partial [Clostridia bacterium]|nr:PTS sugar transporter subunit IIC [Clostridia bacterium]